MKMLFRVFFLLVTSLSCTFLKAETLYIIGHKGSFGAEHTVEHIADYYLLKIKENDVGDSIIPINLPLNNPVRTKFSTTIFNRSPNALSDYWDRLSFRGIRPPIIQNSEQAVVLFVSRIKGSIGYVSQKPVNDQIDVLGEITL